MVAVSTAGVDRPAELAVLRRLDVQVPRDLDHLAVHRDHPGGGVDLRDGERGQLTPPQPAAGRGAGHQLVSLAVPAAASARPSLPMSPAAGISAGSTHSADSPRRGRGVDDLPHVPGRDVLADDRADDRDGEPLAQPPLGVRVLALHVRRAGLQPLGDLPQPDGQLLLGRRLALLPLAVLMPDRPPAAVLVAGRVHGDAVLQLDDLTAAPRGRTPGPRSREPGRSPGDRPMPARSPVRPCRGHVVGILTTAGAACAMGIPSLPA